MIPQLEKLSNFQRKTRSRKNLLRTSALWIKSRIQIDYNPKCQLTTSRYKALTTHRVHS